MTGKKRHILNVFGYGCHIDSPLGWIYLPRVLRFINEVSEDEDLNVVFYGGPTQQASAPGITEAKLMHDWIWKHPDRRRTFYSILEDGSYTTYYNAKYAGMMLANLPEVDAQGHRYSSTRVTITCEATRSANVIMLARYFMLKFVESIDDIAVETASWERADPFKQVGNLIYNKLAITFPWLGLAEREQRKRICRAKTI